MEIKEIIRSVVIGCRSDKIDKAILDELRKIENGEYVPADGWISVEDRLPQLDKYVLICVNDRDHGAGVHSQVARRIKLEGDSTDGMCDWKANGGPMAWFSRNVTHWQPLPSPPKGDK